MVVFFDSAHAQAQLFPFPIFITFTKDFIEIKIDLILLETAVRQVSVNVIVINLGIFPVPVIVQSLTQGQFRKH